MARGHISKREFYEESVVVHSSEAERVATEDGTVRGRFVLGPVVVGRRQKHRQMHVNVMRLDRSRRLVLGANRQDDSMPDVLLARKSDTRRAVVSVVVVCR